MTLHTRELRHCPPQPWRNGGGLTRELLAWPQADGWQLRVSVARIERDGPFSAFAGVQRCFAVLRGAGVRLQLPGGAITLTPADEALLFDGTAAPGCTLVDGATDDLNLMAQAGAGRPRLRRASTGSTLAPARWRGLFACSAAQLQCGAHVETLAADTLAWSDDTAAAKPWQLRQGHGWWLSLEAETLRTDPT